MGVEFKRRHGDPSFVQVPRPCSRLDHPFHFRTTVQHATSRQRSPSEEDHYERPAPQPHTQVHRGSGAVHQPLVERKLIHSSRCSICKTSKLSDIRNTRHRSAAYVSRGSTNWSCMASTHGCLSTRTFRCSPASGSCLICGVARTVRSRLEIQFLHTSQLLLQRSILSSVQRGNGR